MGNGNENGRVVVDRNALIPIGGAISIIVAIITGVWWLSGQFNQAKQENAQQFESMRDEIRDLKYRIERSEQVAIDRWTATHQRLWAAQMQRNNPEIKVPDVSDIIR